MPAEALAPAMYAYVAAECAAAMTRFFPDLVLPRTFAGWRVSDDFAVDFVYTLKYLHQAGHTHLNQRPIADIIHTILTQIDGEKTETFYSYRIAETLLALGGLTEQNPVWAQLNTPQRDNLLNAIDSTHILNQWGKTLGGRPNNYWGVLARCEYARKQLGVLADETILRQALGQMQTLLSTNPHGFFDDSRQLTGRYDIYSADVLLFMRPLWSELEPQRLRAILQAHTRLLESLALADGTFVAWGRSIGLLSVCMTMELGAAALQAGVAQNPQRVYHLVENAFQHAQRWFADHLTNAHRGRMTDGYRGPHRLLQMTFDVLGKIACTAKWLEGITPPAGPALTAEALFPPRDEFIPLGQSAGRTAGVWMYRNHAVQWQLPLVDANSADYGPWLHAPGWFENPVDSALVCGVPRIWAGETGGSVLGTGAPAWESTYAGGGLPTHSEKIPHGLIVTYTDFPRNSGKEGPETLPGSRRVEYRVTGDTLTITDTFTVATTAPTITALSYQIPETAQRPLVVQMSADAPTCNWSPRPTAINIPCPPRPISSNCRAMPGCCARKLRNIPACAIC
jgi:hypothetical protein